MRQVPLFGWGRWRGGNARGAPRPFGLALLLPLGLAAASLTAPRLDAQEAGVVAGTVVTDVTGRPLPGAQVVVQGQPGKGAMSDADGNFRITGVTGTEVVLNARMIGYKPATQTVRVGTTDVRFAMADRPVELDQIVVTGTAGGQQQRSIGNSVARIKASEVTATAAIPSVDGLINGRAPGVVVTPGTGMVGGGANIRIRGMSTFSLSGDPLIYVDGVRVNNETGSGISVQAFGSGVVSRMNDFDPSEIESIEILKGPAAATLYGTEAARGVINIITKKGSNEGTRYNFSLKQGANWFMNPEGRMPVTYWKDPTGKIQSLNIVERENARGTPIFQTGRVQDYSASVSGGAGTLRYFASAAKSNEEGAELNNFRDQFNARTNLGITPNEKVDIQTSLGYVQSHTALSCEGGCGGAMWGASYSTPENLPENCAAEDMPECGWVRGFNSAPPEVDRAMNDWQNVNRFTGSFTVNYKPFTWLSNRLSIGTDFTQEKNQELLPYLTNDTLRYFWGQNADGWKYQNRRDIIFNTYDYNGTARFDLTSKINSATSFGVQYYQKEFSDITAEGDFFPAPGLETVSSAALRPVTGDGYSNNNTLGYYAQQQFAWQNRLFLTAALRVDNNSAFGKDVKWVTYPKAELSWVLNEEPFFADHVPDWVTTFKFRAAYGESGTQPESFTALRTFDPIPGPAGTAALTPGLLGNPSLGPERGKELELGFDAGLFDDRLGLNLTLYDTHTQDAILLRGVAPSTGFGASSQYVNAGEIMNQGIEAMLTAQVLKGDSYGWELGVNFSANRGKVLELTGNDTAIVPGSYQHRIGYAPFSWFRERVVSADFDAATGRAINIMCDDGSGGSMPCYDENGAIIAPRVYLGRVLPAWEGSVTSNVRFLSHFRLSALVDFKGGYKKLDNNIRINCQIFYTCLEAVQPERTDPKRLAQFQSGGGLRDFVFTDGKFAKLREVSLSYDAPASLARRVGARAVTLNLAARNLHTWTNYTGLDPENYFVSGGAGGGSQFTDQAELPQLASFIFSAHLSF
jgi:TonB-linked SusC/RagA family outer membrane protein